MNDASFNHKYNNTKIFSINYCPFKSESETIGMFWLNLVRAKGVAFAQAERLKPFDNLCDCAVNKKPGGKSTGIYLRE